MTPLPHHCPYCGNDKMTERRTCGETSCQSKLLADCKAQACVKAFEPLNTLADARRVLAGINQRCTLAGRPKDQANLSCEHCPRCGGGCEVCCEC